MIEPALSAEEWAEGEFESHYGVARTSFQVDHKGRVFAMSALNDADAVVVLNEAVDAPVVLKKIAALALHGQDFGFTHADVEILRLASQGWDRYDDTGDHLLELSARIAALLPPA